VGGEVALRGRHAGQRRLGSPAWLERDGDAWRPRPGRPKPGWLTERREDEPARLEVFTVEQVEALARAAENGSWRTGPPYETLALDEFRRAEDGQLGDLLRIAAYTGLRRGELVALRWRDVDFEKRSLRVEGSFSHGAVTTTKGGRARAVPLVAEVAQVLARLGHRGYATGPDDPVFPGQVSGHLDASALRRRFVAARDAAGLRPLRFHDLRHTFGSLAINRASIVQVQAWMGHADAKTTMRYLHHKSQDDEAELLAEAFRPAFGGPVDATQMSENATHAAVT
jgi:integrase